MIKDFISIITPCYNEEAVIEKFIKTVSGVLCEMPEDYEIICVDDGSRDRTLEIIKSLALHDEHIRYISFSRNFGKEPAMLAGLEHIRGEMTIIMDADLQHPPELIPQMVSRYREGFDQVIACRNRDGDRAASTFFARIYYKLVNKMVDVKLEDGAGDFRLLGYDVVKSIISMREANRFSKGIFSWVGFRQAHIYYKNKPRAGGETKWSFGKLLHYGLDGIISFNSEPLAICILFGSILLGISIIYLIVLLINILLHGIDVPGYFTTIAIIVLLGGTQLVSLGVMGEYVGRIYTEVKNRPLYLIREENLHEHGHEQEPKEQRRSINGKEIFDKD